MNKIRVLFLLDAFGIGGSERVISLMVNHINKDKFEPIIGSFSSVGKLRNSPNAKSVRISKADVVRDLKEHKIDAVVLMADIDEKTASLIKTKCKLLRIVNFTQLYSDTFDANLITTKTDHLKISLLHKGKLVNDYVLYHPVAVDKWRKLFLSERVKPFFKKSQKIVVGRIGRAEPSKWHYLILGLLHAVKKNNAFDKFSFLYAGMPRLYEAYIKLFFSKELQSKSIVLLPELKKDEDVARFYKTIDLFHQACWIGESFGMVIAESFCFEKPVVTEVKAFATPNGKVRKRLYDAQIELVEDGVNGYYANYPEEVFGFLARTNREELGRLGRRGYLKTKELYDVQVIVKNLEHVIISLQKGERARIEPSPKEIKGYSREYFKKLDLARNRDKRVSWISMAKYSVSERIWRFLEWAYLLFRKALKLIGLSIERKN